VLWPSKQYYEELVADFTDISLSKKIEKAVKKLAFLAKEAIERIEETLHIDTETLTDDYEDTDAENNSSLVLFLQADQKRILFTWDVGKEWLKRVIEFADNNKINISEIDILDIPHHGSKRNLWPTILNRLKPKKACISCPKEWDPKHPSRKVVNALIRRWADVLTTKWSTKCYKHKTETRSWWTTATLETFHSHVED
jgi:beta-lactamase superfamily II metal-dependent hydrolase